MRIAAGLRAAAAAVAVCLLLPGCAAATEQLIEQQAGVEIATDGDGGVSIQGDDGEVQIGSGTSLPDDFPAEFPTPEANLVAVVAADGGWSLSYEGVERDDVDAIAAHYSSAGYEEVFTAVQGQTFQASFQNDTWAVTLLWDGSGESKALVYAVTPR